MARPRIDEILRLMDRAFETSEHSLLKNLATVHPESWDKLPQGAARSIKVITKHVGLFKYLYANHGFRGAELDYGDPPATPPAERLASPEDAVQWLREGHLYLTGCIQELSDDSELDVLRRAHWGGQVPTHHLLATMLEHDLYHAGEINRTRALLQADDNWFVPPVP